MMVMMMVIGDDDGDNGGDDGGDNDFIVFSSLDYITVYWMYAVWVLFYKDDNNFTCILLSLCA